MMPRGGRNDGNPYHRDPVNEEETKHDYKVHGSKYVNKSGNTNYEVTSRSYFKVVGLFLATNWMMTIIFAVIIGILFSALF